MPNGYGCLSDSRCGPSPTFCTPWVGVCGGEICAGSIIDPNGPLCCGCTQAEIANCICYSAGQNYQPACFLKDTLINTGEGQTPIQLLETGSHVLSMGKDGAMHLSKVSNILKRQVEEYLILHLSDGTKINVTGEHPFWSVTDRRYVKAETLYPGQGLLKVLPGTEVQTSVFVTDITRIRARGTWVYNLTVDGDHTYFSEGVLVHNKSPIAFCYSSAQ